MVNLDDNSGQLHDRVLAMAQRLDRTFETIKKVVQLFQSLLADVDAGGTVAEENSATIRPRPGKPSSTVPSPTKCSNQQDSRTAEPPREFTKDWIYVTSLLNGLPGDTRLSRQDARAFVTRDRFELVIDETADTLAFAIEDNSHSEFLHTIPPQIKVMCWLVLTHVGKPLKYEGGFQKPTVVMTYVFYVI